MWRKIGPWATPALVVAEIVLVWSGLLSIGGAVIIAVLVESLLAVTAITRGLAAWRCFREGRAAGRAVWIAAEDGLAQIAPRPLARALLIEARMWACLLSWVGGRHDGNRPGAFSYRGGLHALLVAVLAFTVVEGATVEVVLAAAFPHSAWPWIVLALHGYGVVWLAGLLASLHTQPHLLDTQVLRLRDSIFAEIVIGYAAITDVRRIHESGLARSGFKTDPATGSARLTYGDATIVLTLDPVQTIEINGQPVSERLHSLSITVDDPGTFQQALAARLTEATTAADG